MDRDDWTTQKAMTPLRADDSPEHAVKMLMARMWAIEQYVIDLEQRCNDATERAEKAEELVNDLESRLDKLSDKMGDRLDELRDDINHFEDRLNTAESDASEAYSMADKAGDNFADFEAGVKEQLWRYECEVSRLYNK